MLKRIQQVEGLGVEFVGIDEVQGGGLKGLTHAVISFQFNQG
jgi:hypothetical protein